MSRPFSRAVVIGSSGGIGSALARALEERGAKVVRLARSGAADIGIDLEDEASIEAAARACAERGPFDLVFVAAGLLHDDSLQPEKTFRDLDRTRLLRSFSVNAVGPALVAKYFLPLLPRTGRSLFACLSARVGSISDNRLGGWYGYRASKAALNMLVRTLSVELARSRPEAICVGLHPGTVDTALSEPFQRNVPAGRLFSAQQAAEQLLDVIEGLDPAQSGRLFAWDGSEIAP